MGAIWLIVGLGLAIVKYVAEARGGVVTVSSQPGRRSTFAINLPAAAESLPYGLIPPFSSIFEAILILSSCGLAPGVAPSVSIRGAMT